jgi:circadian clock protein KaiC
MSDKAAIRCLPSGVPGLDAILGGGIPEFALSVIIGSPGAGKTTLAHQIMFALAARDRPAVFFSVLGESPLKMLRYQQQFSFFQPNMVGDSIHYVNLSDEIATGDFDQVMKRIKAEVKAIAPATVCVDSFRSVMLELQAQSTGKSGLQNFVYELGIFLAGWQATTFLVGEYASGMDTHPIFTIADGLIFLEQNVHRNSMVRKLQVMKMRGHATSPGMHTFRITNAGIETFPSAPIRDDSGVENAAVRPPPVSQARLTMGIAGLDEMLGGGLPAGYSLLVAGPSGSGKTILATAFLAEGVRRNQPGVIVAFEQTPSQSRTRTIDDLVRAGHVGLINTRSMDLSIDEIVQHLIFKIQRMKATRVVIDSLSGFELAVAPTFREDFRESLFRMVAALSGLGVTVLMTSELEDRYTDLRFSPYGTAFLTDAIVVQRYIEIASRLGRVMSVVKVRGSAHSTEIRQFEITDEGIAIGTRIDDYEGLLGGRPLKNLSIDGARKGRAT